MEHNIEKLMNDKKTLSERVSDGLDRELLRQKQAGKEFISDEQIDTLIDKIIKEELGESFKEDYTVRWDEFGSVKKNYTIEIDSDDDGWLSRIRKNIDDSYLMTDGDILESYDYEKTTKTSLDKILDEVFDKLRIPIINEECDVKFI